MLDVTAESFNHCREVDRGVIPKDPAVLHIIQMSGFQDIHVVVGIV